jgi:hypothetical protein
VEYLTKQRLEIAVLTDREDLEIDMFVTDPYGREHRVDVKVINELAIDEDRLDVEYTEQPARLGWWLVLLSWKNKEVGQKKLRLNRIKAERYLELRRLHEASNEKFTEGLLTQEVSVSATVAEAENDYNKADAEFETLRGMVKAMADRTDSLVSLGAHVRASGELSLRDTAKSLRHIVAEEEKA